MLVRSYNDRMKSEVAERHATEPIAPQTQFILAHLLLWLFATCVVLAYEQWRLKLAWRDDSFRWYFNGRLLLYAPLDGACLAALLLCFYRKAIGGSRFPSEPGHWILIVTGGLNVLSAVLSTAVQLIGEERLNALPEWLSVTYSATFSVVSVALALFAASVLRKELLWSLTFVVIALGSLGSILHLMLVANFKGNRWFLNDFAWGLCSRLLFSLPAIVVICAVIFERPRRRHDFLHWAGVAVLLLRVVAEWPSWIVWLRMFR
jgi:hypothetical protein